MGNLRNKMFAKVGFLALLSFVLFVGSLQAFAGEAQAYSSTKAKKIISTANSFKGTPYLYGAKAGRTDRFDCSSFVQYVYKKQGIKLPRTSKNQSKAGTYVAKKNLKPGDLVFFYKPIHHVGIYIGNGKIIHTYGKPGVTISSIKSGWWSKNYTTARRVIK